MRRSDFISGKRDFHRFSVGTVMQQDVITCRASDSGRAVASQMTEHNIGSLPVIDSKEKLVGLVSEFDLLKDLMEGQELCDVRAEEIMNRGVRVLEEDAPIDQAIRTMETEYLIRMPVVKDGKLVAILARRDVLMGYIKATDRYWP